MTDFERFLRRVYSPAFVACYLLLMIVSYVFLDRLIAIWIYHHPNLSKNALIQLITKLGLGWPYIVGLPLIAGVYFFYQKIRSAYQIFYVWISVCACGLVVDILKIIFSRARPKLLLQQDIYGFHWLQWQAKYWSFPSGHSSVILSLSLAMSLLYQPYAFVFLAFGAIVAITRVMVLAHFLSDIMGAFLLSAFVVLMVLDKLRATERFKPYLNF